MRTRAKLFGELPIAATILFFFASFVTAADSPRQFSHPERIRYDSQCLTIDGKDMFIYSGAFHYFRCPKELWRDRFQKIKDAGFNTVETYVPWNWHEREMPKDFKDFSKVNLDELNEWLKMAEDFGFYIIIRPGPYICAEWDTGGFPQWLLTKKPATFPGDWLRSAEPTFLAWERHWYEAVCPVIAKHQITKKSKGKPGVILFQLENEYDFAKFPDDVKVRQLRALAAAASANGIDVPFFTCWTKQVRGSRDPLLRQVFDACNFYPRWNVDKELNSNIPKLRAEQPDAPLATTELQGGWFSKVGDKLSEEQEGVTASQINYITLLAIEHGETLLNYYMLFGGWNPESWGARTMTTTYDYNAPIREWGGVGDRYQRVSAIGQMLRDHGAKLARAEKVDYDVTLSSPDNKPVKDVSVVVRQAADGSRYIFLRTSQHTETRQGTARLMPKASGGETHELVLNFKLGPFASAILYLPPGVTDPTEGEWLPRPAPAVERPDTLPAKIEITSARRQSDTGPKHWTRVKVGQRLAQAGVYDSDFLFYKTTTSDALKTNFLVWHTTGDSLLATVNGKLAPRVSTNSTRSVFGLPTGFNKLLLLYENLGHANMGNDMENASGISAARLTGVLSPMKPITGWRMQEVDSTHDRLETRMDCLDNDWTPATVDKVDANTLPAGHIAVYRATVFLTSEDLHTGTWHLSFGRIDDHGWIYVNGQKAGESTDWTREYSTNATFLLQPGPNVIAVIVRNTDGTGGIGMPGLTHAPEGRDVHLEGFGRPAGVEEGWSQPSLDDKFWDPVKIGQTPPSTKSILDWYRMSFNMPSEKRHEWVPWRLNLNASGNGFLYLNGHPLGRYWQAGPQHAFFLPECWINFGGENVVTASLRPLDKGTSIQAASVEPYGQFAEKR